MFKSKRSLTPQQAYRANAPLWTFLGLLGFVGWFVPSMQMLIVLNLFLLAPIAMWLTDNAENGSKDTNRPW